MTFVDQAFWPTIVRARLLIGLHLEANEGQYLLEWDGLPNLPVYPVFTVRCRYCVQTWPTFDAIIDTA